MVQVKIPYYVVKNGRGYFEPWKALRAQGLEPRPLGPDGPEAWAEAQRLYEDWQRSRKGEAPVAQRRAWPIGSIGFAFERYKRTEAWAAKAESTRVKDWEWSWRIIEPIFGDVAPATVQIEDIEALYRHTLKTKGLHTAHRMIKTWRALWRVMAAMQYCHEDKDPSKIIRNAQPRGRSATWAPGEIARIGKEAWRRKFYGLAAILAVIWDTQFSPVDARTLTPAQWTRDKAGGYFKTKRNKTGKDAIGSLTRRTARILEAYLKKLGAEPLASAPLFRNRSGQPYTADTLGDDFRDVRSFVFPKDKRQMVDIRRTGAVEALAGDAEPAQMAQKMANSIDKSQHLADTYLPSRVAIVRQVDEARRKGRRKLREGEK